MTTQRVFLSHSSADKVFVRLLADELMAFGADIWLDELELEVGDLLSVRLQEAIQSSSFLIACLSPHSILSEWVRREIAIGEELRLRGHKMIVVPLLFGALRDDQRPEALLDHLYVDCRSASDYDTGLRTLLRALERADGPRDLTDIMTGFDRQPLPFDAARARRFVAAASGSLREWLCDSLASVLPRQQDPTARYFIYRTLGMIGGAIAIRQVLSGRDDLDAWARKGALEAAAELGIEPTTRASDAPAAEEG